MKPAHLNERRWRNWACRKTQKPSLRSQNNLLESKSNSASVRTDLFKMKKARLAIKKNNYLLQAFLGLCHFHWTWAKGLLMKLKMHTSNVTTGQQGWRRSLRNGRRGAVKQHLRRTSVLRYYDFKTRENWVYGESFVLVIFLNKDWHGKWRLILCCISLVCDSLECFILIGHYVINSFCITIKLHIWLLFQKLPSTFCI